MTTVARLAHPNILKVYDFGEQKSVAYIVMEYVDGGTLENKLMQMGRLSSAEAITFVMQAAMGLEVAHKQKVIHGDVKPGNMLLRRGEHLLLDYSEPISVVNSPGHITGTPAYMSPERMDDSVNIGPSVDIYSLGITLFYCLTGQLPFNGDFIEVMRKHMAEPLPVGLLRKANISQQIEQIILKMTAKAPTDRYQTISEVVHALVQADYKVPPVTISSTNKHAEYAGQWTSNADRNADVQQNAPSPQSTLAILLGASQWPYHSDLTSSKAFFNSANSLKAYLLNPRQFGLTTENLLNLFDYNQSADDLDRLICEFLDQRIDKMKRSGNPAKDLLVYYVGHGGFAGTNYYLAIRRTRKESPKASGIEITSLADTLKEKARRLRRMVILDCCYAASAFRAFQSGPGQIAILQAVDAFKEKEIGQGIGYPERGTALLCSSGPGRPSLISQDGSHTMFTEALLKALTRGNPRQPNKSHLSPREITTLTKDFLKDAQEKDAPMPEIHSPAQPECEAADVPFFPNLAAQLRYTP